MRVSGLWSGLRLRCETDDGWMAWVAVKLNVCNSAAAFPFLISMAFSFAFSVMRSLKWRGKKSNDVVS